MARAYTGSYYVTPQEISDHLYLTLKTWEERAAWVKEQGNETWMWNLLHTYYSERGTACPCMLELKEHATALQNLRHRALDICRSGGRRRKA